MKLPQDGSYTLGDAVTLQVSGLADVARRPASSLGQLAGWSIDNIDMTDPNGALCQGTRSSRAGLCICLVHCWASSSEQSRILRYLLDKMNE